MYQSIPSNTIPHGKPRVNLQNLANPRQIFCQMSSPQTFLGTFILINFTLSHQFQDLSHKNSLQNLTENIYLSIENIVKIINY